MIRTLDEIYMIDPCMGSRRLPVKLRDDYGIETSCKQVQRLRRKMGIETICCRQQANEHTRYRLRKYPYWLKGAKNQRTRGGVLR